MDEGQVIPIIQGTYDKIEEFCPSLSSVRKKLKKKKENSIDIIHDKMQELHGLIDKWERRLAETAAETIDEKIESLLKQEEKLRTVQSQVLYFIENYAHSEWLTEVSLNDSSSSNEDSSVEDSEKEEILSLLQLFRSVEYPLHPTDIKDDENLDVDVEEFGILLDEAKKSLKRSLSFIGGIVRGYLRRGKKNDKWVEMLRKLESREYETEGIHLDKISFGTAKKKPFSTDNDNKHFQIWKIVSDIYKYRGHESLQSELCNQLAKDYSVKGNEIDSYLPQLCIMIINMKNFAALEEFILLQCHANQNFSLQVLLILTSFSDIGSSLWRRRCKKLLKKVEIAVSHKNREIDDTKKNAQIIAQIKKSYRKIRKEQKKNTHSEDSNDTLLEEFPQNHIFFSQYRFLYDLCALAEAFETLFEKGDNATDIDHLLKNSLRELDHYLHQGLAYIPHGVDSRERILRFIDSECTIRTLHGTVASEIVLETCEVPIDWTKELENEYIEQHKHSAEGGIPSELSTNLLSTVYGEFYTNFHQRLRQISPFGSIPTWNLHRFTTKKTSSIVQEMFVMQLILQFQRIFDLECVPLTLTPYKILPISSTEGLIESLPNAVSIANIKQNFSSIHHFFQENWPEPEQYEKARQNFIQSSAAYSLLCYFLQIKDRHNKNILIDSTGKIIHIDFGFLLSKTIKFDKAPFKLTEDFIEVMGGSDSEGFQEYVRHFVDGFLAVRQHYEKILLFVEMSLLSGHMGEQIIPCLEDNEALKLRKRFKIAWKETQIEEYVIQLIFEATDNWRTTIYDTYQLILNDIF